MPYELYRSENIYEIIKKIKKPMFQIFSYIYVIIYNRFFINIIPFHLLLTYFRNCKKGIPKFQEKRIVNERCKHISWGRGE